jgi:archaellum component FlaC
MTLPSSDDVKNTLSQTQFNQLTGSNIPPLASSQISALADIFDNMRTSFKFERRLIEAGGVTAAEQERWEILDRTESKLMRLVTKLDAIAFSTLIQIDLNEFNQEIIDSTNKLKKAAEKLQDIKNTINQFVVIVDFIAKTVGDIATGGAFSISGLFANVEQLLKDLEIDI